MAALLSLIIKNENVPTTKEDKSSLIMSALDADHDEFDLFVCIFMDAAKNKKGLKEYLSKQFAKNDLEQYRYVITKRTLEEVVAEFNVTMNEGVLFQYMISLGIPFV
ncbi:hypothetical protein NX023_02475 [Cytobacillus firmus]|nr:hypothetical protein [Cytobacillus firmus]